MYNKKRSYKMKKSLQRKVSFLLAAVMLLTAFVFTTTAGAAQTGESTAAQSYGLPDKIEDGAILHCWCWNFATIKENLPKIAEAGFKSIQTSPINAFQVGDGGKMSLMSTSSGKWWYQYQTTDYTIGNYMLGTKEEFMDMCAQAHKLGVKVIVDIVANHCSSDYSVISSHVKNIGGKAFHDRVEISDWSNRYQVTQGKLTGLWDLNTQNPAVQFSLRAQMVSVLTPPSTLNFPMTTTATRAISGRPFSIMTRSSSMAKSSPAPTERALMPK